MAAFGGGGGLAQYAAAVGQAAGRRDGPALGALLRLKDQRLVAAVRQAGPGLDPGAVARGMPGHFAAVLAAYVAAAGHLGGAHGAVPAYNAMQGAVQPTLDAFREDEANWSAEALHAVADSLTYAAGLADAELEARGKAPHKLESAGNHLMSFFSAAHRAQGNKLKRLATLRIANALFKVYFKLNTLRLCKNIIRAIDAKNFVPFEAFPKGQRVTYMYFTGRLAIFDDRFVDAEQKLAYAFQHTPARYRRNRRLIARYLLPVKLLLGQLPSRRMRAQLGLDDAYGGIMEAMQTGSLRAFDQALATNLAAYIRDGTYLVLEKLRYAVLRRLLKRVLLIHAELRPEKRAQLPLALYQAALGAQGEAMDLDEVECVVANMIYRKYVKGYISHKSRVLVVSKSDPFPALTAALLADPM